MDPESKKNYKSSSPSPSSAMLQILTPDKPAVPLIKRARNGGVAFSVKGVRRAALGLRQRAEKAKTAALDSNDDDLRLVQKELDVSSGAEQSPKPAKVKAQIKIPEKYGMLCEFFNSMESSIRLLRLRGSMATFTNICTSIQHLSERRFTYRHLAQLKYIMPEAIMLKKVLLRDEATCCMKPDLQIILQVEGVANEIKQNGENGYSVLRRIFRQRAVDFFKEHPEGDDIPEVELPHPFNQPKICMPSTIPKVSMAPTVTESSYNASQQQPVVLSHMSHSFTRRFSKKAQISATEQLATCTSSVATMENASASSIMSPMRSAPKPPVLRKPLLSSPSPLRSNVKCETAEEVRKSIKDAECMLDDSHSLEGTPAKLVSTPMRLMIVTPDMQTPKRPFVETKDESTPLKKAIKRSAQTKLFNTPVKCNSGLEEEDQNRSSSTGNDDGVLSFLPKSLLQSVREKEKRVLEEKENGFADKVRRQKLIACLPSTFDVVLLIYQSMQRSVITKQELIHKMIARNPKIVDRGEAVEQLKLFEELVPDWISEKTACSGDILCCVNMTFSPDEIRQRLSNAE